MNDTVMLISLVMMVALRKSIRRGKERKGVMNGSTNDDGYDSGGCILFRIGFDFSHDKSQGASVLTLAADQSMASSDDEWPEKNATSAFVGGDQGSMNDI